MREVSDTDLDAKFFDLKEFLDDKLTDARIDCKLTGLILDAANFDPDAKYVLVKVDDAAAAKKIGKFIIPVNFSWISVNYQIIRGLRWF